jgi:hypothetical protein
MARSKPKPILKPPPSDREVAAWAAEAQLKQDEAVKWYEDVLGFPEPCAKALYIDQTLTDVEILSNLSDKSIDAICNAIRKPGEDSKGNQAPVLAVERLKLAAFCIKLYERTSRDLPDWCKIERYDIKAVEYQKRIEDDYLFKQRCRTRTQANVPRCALCAHVLRERSDYPRRHAGKQRDSPDLCHTPPPRPERPR